MYPFIPQIARNEPKPGVSADVENSRWRARILAEHGLTEQYIHVMKGAVNAGLYETGEKEMAKLSP